MLIGEADDGEYTYDREDMEEDYDKETKFKKRMKKSSSFA